MLFDVDEVSYFSRVDGTVQSGRWVPTFLRNIRYMCKITVRYITTIIQGVLSVFL
jgi:hypothetical protein